MTILDSLKKKEYYFHIALIVLAIMLFQTKVSELIIKYVSLNGFFLDFVSITLILLVSDLVLHTIWEI